MNVKSLKSLRYVAAIIALSAPAFAGTITNSSNNNNPLNALGSGAETTAQLAGTTVTFNYSGTASETATFNTTGQATDSAGDTLTEGGNVWQIENNQNSSSITSVVITGTGIGSSSLTALLDPATDGGTNGVQNGAALFTSPIGLNGNPPSSELFAIVTITPTGGVGGGGSQASYTFDDTIHHLTGPVTAGSITASPEPSTVIMLSGGLFALAALRRRRFFSK